MTEEAKSFSTIIVQTIETYHYKTIFEINKLKKEMEEIKRKDQKKDEIKKED